MSPPEVLQHGRCTVVVRHDRLAMNAGVVLGGMTKNLYHGIFQNDIGFTVYRG